MNMPPLRYKPACTSASQVVCLPNSRAHIKIQKDHHAPTELKAELTQ